MGNDSLPIQTKMAGPTRLELATFGVTGRRSNQLNYDPACWNPMVTDSLRLYLIPSVTPESDKQVTDSSLFPAKTFSNKTLSINRVSRAALA